MGVEPAEALERIAYLLDRAPGAVVPGAGVPRGSLTGRAYRVVLGRFTGGPVDR